VYRSVRYSSADKHCRYLDASLCHEHWSGFCGGRFGRYLCDRFDLEKLPYDLKLSTLILNRAFSPDLFVKLPDTFFRKWTNFPECPAFWESDLNVEEIAAGYYDIHYHYFSSDEFTLNDLLHPYDREPRQEDFVQRFQSEIPQTFNIVKLAKSRRYLSNEAYFAYWRGYVLVDALYGYLDIEKFLPAEEGMQKIIAIIAKTNNYWNEQYSCIFNRISLYRTSTAILVSDNIKNNLTYREIGSFLLNYAGELNPNCLEEDLEKLLVLFSRWHRLIESDGRISLKTPLELLRQDIYFLFEWLCTSTDLDENHYFDKWSYKHMCAEKWTQLEDVLNYEEFKLKKTFLRNVPYYCGEIKEFGYLDDLTNVYVRLCDIEGFEPWNRSFLEIHKSLNKNSIIQFKQPRILDYLIVISIRTEIVIRGMFCKYIQKEDPTDLRKVFSGLVAALKNEMATKVLLSLNNDWKVTKLNEKPEEIFARIDSIKSIKGWSKESLHFYKQILKFVTSRNYFAHHSYKDDCINSGTSLITAEVLKSCIQSLVFLYSAFSEKLEK